MRPGSDWGVGWKVFGQGQCKRTEQPTRFQALGGSKRDESLVHVLKNLQSGEKPRHIHRLQNVVRSRLTQAL